MKQLEELLSDNYFPELLVSQEKAGEKIASSPNNQPPEHVFDGLVEKVIAASLGELTVGHQGFPIVICKVVG